MLLKGGPARPRALSCFASAGRQLHRAHRGELFRKSGCSRHLEKVTDRGASKGLQVMVTAAPAQAKHTATAQQSASFKMEGQCFACITPFLEGSEKLNAEGLRQYLQFLWSQGGRNIIINGTSGEFSAMTTAERKQALEVARSVWPSNSGASEPSVLMNNISGTCLNEIFELLRHSEEHISTPHGQCTRADAVLVLPPYYLAGVPEQGNAEFLRRVLAASSLPVFIYNFPANTNCLVSPGLYAQLAEEFPNLRGVKNTFEDTQLAKQFKDAAPELQVYVGSDKLSMDTLQNDMDGVIGGGGSSVLARPFVEIWHAHQRGDLQRARALQDIMNKWTAHREKTGLMDIPAGKAGMLKHLPKLSSTCRPPLVAGQPAEIETLNTATDAALESAQSLCQ